MNIEPHQFQADAIEACRGNSRSGIKRQILLSPTGSGKTTIGGFMAQSAVQKDRRVIWVAQGRELILQAADRMKDFDIHHGVIMGAQSQDRAAPMQVCSVDTLRARAKKEKYPPADLIFVDECHRTSARSYGDILAAFPDAYVIGLTATPCRDDNKKLGDIYEKMVEAATLPWLIENNFLVRPDTYTWSADAFLDTEMKGRDFDPEKMGQRVLKISGDIVDLWKEKANNRKTVLFAPDVKTSMAFAEMFLHAGVSAVHIDGTTPREIRDSVDEKIISGEIQVVCNFGVYTTGWDCPPVSCAIIARLTKNIGLLYQMPGRILRTYPGKTDAIILDVCGNYRKGGQCPGGILGPRKWVLEKTEPKKPRKTIFQHGTPSAKKLVIENADLELEKIITDGGAAIRQYLADLKSARAKQFNPGWAFRRLREYQGDACAKKIGQLLTPIKLGKLVGLSGVKMNTQLAALGMQRRVHDRWILTDRGSMHAQSYPPRNPLHAPKIVWSQTVFYDE